MCIFVTFVLKGSDTVKHTFCDKFVRMEKLKNRLLILKNFFFRIIFLKQKLEEILNCFFFFFITKMFEKKKNKHYLFI